MYTWYNLYNYSIITCVVADLPGVTALYPNELPGLNQAMGVLPRAASLS